MEYFILELVDLAYLDTQIYIFFFYNSKSEKVFLKDCIRSNQVLQYLIKSRS